MSRGRLSAGAYLEGILAGDVATLSRAITLIESTLPSDRALAEAVLTGCLSHLQPSFRLGVSGPPGVGKSTFIEAFVPFLLPSYPKVAVLAVDPTSQRTGGSILGDKTRMSQIAQHPGVFIRPSPAGNTLGGVARRTREAMLLCEAAGYTFIIVETVGVGQSETLVHGMVDYFLVLLLPGGGDELQGVKRGVIELADGLAVTKADGDSIRRAHQTLSDYKQAQHLMPKPPSGMPVATLAISALTKLGLPELFDTLNEYRKFVQSTGYFYQRRNQQQLRWFEEAVEQLLLERFYSRHAGVMMQFRDLVASGSLPPTAAAEALFRKLGI